MKPKTGAEMIAQERKEQVLKHGRTVESDVKNNADGELWKGARAIIDPDHNEWPENWNKEIWHHIINTKTRIEQLAVAGALIAAEIDRLQNEII